MLLAVQTHRFLFSFNLAVFLLTTVEFSHNSQGRAGTFSQKHAALSSQTHTLLHPLPAQVCSRDEGQTTKTFKQ